ncbi:MAG TPA: hypothetical protein VMZ92_14835 [Planctomycetota bacterium]|nr:hypothetical protein [Planctomycetota bacterium]
MIGEGTRGPKAEDLLKYLDIATKFRNHEFNIQMLRNVVFTGSHAVLLACYAATITNDYPGPALGLALFGGLLSFLWWCYYRGSLYWARYWEYHCRQINDEVVSLLNADVDLFKGHPAGERSKEPPPNVYYAGKEIRHSGVHRWLYAVHAATFVLWLVLAIAAGVSSWHSAGSSQSGSPPRPAEPQTAPSR